MKSLFWITSSLPTFTFMLYFALPLLQSSETMTTVSYVLIAVFLILYLIGCVAKDIVEKSIQHSLKFSVPSVTFSTMHSFLSLV